MKWRIFGFSLIFVGVLCAVSAISIKMYSDYAEALEAKEAANAWEQAVRENTFMVNRETFDPEVEESEGLVTIIDGFDGDQEVAEVVTYKNVLSIPKIDVQAYIGEGTSAYNLARGVGRHTETVKVGAEGNCVVAGHASLTYNRILNRLEEMQMFDTFVAYDAKGKEHTYYIVRRMVVEPDQTSILDNTNDGKSTMTIYTCTEGGIRRFVLVGVEMTDEEFAEYRDEYYSGRAEHMVALGNSVSIVDIASLLDMRDTYRTYMDYSSIILRPWLSDDSVNSDLGVLNFGI